tara:strand:- start:7094 stop:9445 length:2352 start_codon:yes stop_codon:yes gene_type:complete
MNDSGDFFTGYKKLSSITGEEEVLEAPVFTYVGDDAEAETIKRASGVFDEVLIRESLTVEGGDNNNRTSQFYGPVNFTEKITNTSDDGIETINLSIRGDAPQGKLLTVGISTPVDAARSGDISFAGVPNAGGYLGHIFAEGEWRRFGVVSQETNRSFYKVDQLGIGRSDNEFTFQDSLEVNGVVKIKDLFVAGVVTFAANQSFAGVSYDTLVIKKNANFWGYNTTGGISYDGIPWENHGYYTQVHEAGTSRLYNMEVVGTYVTFKPAAAIHFEGPWKSTFAGVSTFAGTLKVGNLESTGGTFNGTFVNADNGSFGTLEAVNQLYASSGIVTNIVVTDAAIAKNYSDIGITTISHVGTEYVNTSNIFSGIATNLQVTNQATIANETVTNATITNLTVPSAGGGNADIELANIADLTCTDITFTDDLIGPDAFFSNDVDSDGLTTRYIGSKYPSNPGNEAEQLTIFANAGIYTCIVGFAATIERINMTPGGNGLTAPTIRANTGIITALSAGSGGNMTIDAGTAGQVKSFQFQSTATNVPPLVVASTSKCINLNADLLDGLSTKDTNWSSGASIMARNSQGSTKVKDITATGIFQGGSGAFPSGLTATNSTLSGSNSINNLTVTGTFSASGGLNGNATTATTATNVVGGANRVLFNSSSNSTTTSSNLTFDGTDLSVGGDITAFASDMRLKTNLEQIEGAVAKVCKLSGFTYEFNEIGLNLGLNNGRHLGVSAQEVQDVFPEAVAVRPTDEYLTVKYEKLVPVLIEAIKELKAEIDTLKDVTNLE